MRFARFVYALAALYGFITLPPLYFLQHEIDKNTPHAITHLEFYYGFIGLALLWQCIFVLMAINPVRYQAIMPLTIFEKFAYSLPVFVLYAGAKANFFTLFSSLVDSVFGVLFIAAHLRSRVAMRNVTHHQKDDCA